MKKLKSKSGFTLIELLVTVAVLSIVLVVGLPQLGSISQGNKMTVTINDLSGDLDFARNQAIYGKDGGQVRVVSNNANADWSGGWSIEIVGGDVLRNTGAIDNGLTLEGPDDRITFNNEGHNTAGVNVTFLLCRTALGAGNNGKSITVNTSGRPQYVGDQPCP